MKNLVILGSTGSIGTQTLDVVRNNEGLNVLAVSAAKNVKLIEEQIREFSPAVCAMSDSESARDLKSRVGDTNCKVLGGDEAICQISAAEKNNIVVNAITGVAGLRPSLAVIEAGKDLALANKETIVTAGDLVLEKAREKKSAVLPVDSEHSAIFQCIGNSDSGSISRLILTASGGPFYGMTKAELASVTPERALKHPVWSMGSKITIDSATLMNKGFEIIEASRLFDVPCDKIDVVVHPEGIIHSLVEYTDKAVLAQLSNPDMRLCIQYALTYPHRAPSALNPLSLADIGTLTFKKVDVDTFKLIPLAYKVCASKGTLGATLNGANERAVELFLNGKIAFLDIFDYVFEAVESAKEMPLTVENVFAADNEARRTVDKISGR